MNYRILLTGFQSTSSEQLLLPLIDSDRLLLPNDKKRDSALLEKRLSEMPYDFVICTGQKPNIKDKICIEVVATDAGTSLETTVNCQKLACTFEKHGISAKLSYNAGTSFCNALYFSGLRSVAERYTDTLLVFIHIPFMKNIGNPQLFMECFLAAVEEMKVKGVNDLWIR